MVDPERKRTGKFFLYARYTDSWAMFMGTEYFVTSSIQERTEEGSVITKNSTYQLGTMALEYHEFLEATRKGMLAIGNWNIYGCKNRYYLTGDVFPQKKALPTSKIVAQDGNYLTITRLVETPTGERVWEDPEKVFICWSSMSKHAQSELQSRGKVADIAYEKFEQFNGKTCKPILSFEWIQKRRT